MTISSYIKQRFQTFGIQLSEADLFDILRGKRGEDEMNEDVKPLITFGILKFIPSLFLHASVSESGFSVTKAQRDDILKYYSITCKELGVKDELTEKPKVKFL